MQNTSHSSNSSAFRQKLNQKRNILQKRKGKKNLKLIYTLRFVYLMLSTHSIEPQLYSGSPRGTSLAPTCLKPSKYDLSLCPFTFKIFEVASLIISTAPWGNTRTKMNDPIHRKRSLPENRRRPD